MFDIVLQASCGRMSSQNHQKDRSSETCVHFLQTCPRDYDDDIELRTNKLAQKMMKQQVKTVASLWECVGECTKNATNKGRGNKSPHCALWADKTQDMYHEQTRQGPVLCLENMLTKNRTTQTNHVGKRYARNNTTWTKDMLTWTKDM